MINVKLSTRLTTVLAVSLAGLETENTNTAPTATPQSVTTAYETALPITLTGTDPDPGDVLTYNVTVQPDWGTLTGTAPNLTYTPSAGYSGSDSFVFVVNDGTVDSAPATVSIEVEAEPFALVNLPGQQWYIDPMYEGGNHPASLAAEAQNAALADAGSTDIISDWSTNGRHTKKQPGYNDVTWNEESGTDAYFRPLGNTSFDTQNGGLTTYPPIDNEFTKVYVFRDTGDSGYGMAYNSNNPALLRRSDGSLELLRTPLSTVVLTDNVGTDWNVLVWTEGPAGSRVHYNGETKLQDDTPSPDFADSLRRIWSNATNGSNWQHDQGPGELTNQQVDLATVKQIEARMAERYGITLGGVVNVTFPEQGAVFQRQAGDVGVIRVRGTYDASIITGGVSLEARWGGAGAYTACTLDAINETFTVELTGQAQGTGQLEVRSTDLTYTSTVDDVGVGDVWFVIGQSNAGRIAGAAGNATYLGASHAGVYDPFNYPETLWGTPDNKWWRAQFLERARADRGVPVAVVAYSKGATNLSQWLPGSTEDYLAQAYQVLLDSQGITVAYDAVTHGDLCVEMLCQWGERDSQLGTSAADVRARVESIAGHANTNYGITSRWSKVQVMDITYASAANQAAYRTGIDDAVANNAFISAGADLETLTTPTQWTGTEGVHPATVAELDGAGDSWADAVGLAA